MSEATPNLREAAWMTGRELHAAQDVLQAGHHFGNVVRERAARIEEVDLEDECVQAILVIEQNIGVAASGQGKRYFDKREPTIFRQEQAAYIFITQQTVAVEIEESGVG